MEQGRSFRVISYNIRFGGLGREELLTQVLQGLDADLVIFQEATHPKVIAGVAEGLGAAAWASKRGFSLGFVSRSPVRHWRWHRLPQLKHPVLEVDPHHSCTVYGVHLRPHLFKWIEKKRVGEVNAFLSIVRGNREVKPHVVVGDFNSIAPDDEAQVSLMPTWIRALIHLSGGKILTEVIQKIIEADYTDGYRWLHGRDSGFTFPSLYPRLRLDYAFLSSGLPDQLRECTVISDSPDLKLASDHLPLLTVLEEP